MVCFERVLCIENFSRLTVGLHHPSVARAEQLHFMYIAIERLHNTLKKRSDAKISPKTSVQVDNEWEWINQIRY